MKDWLHASDEGIDNMTFEEAKEIAKRQIDLGHKTGDFKPRAHMTKALEIILDRAEIPSTNAGANLTEAM